MGTGALDKIFLLTPGDPPPEVPFAGTHAVSISPFAVAKSATLATASAHVAALEFGATRGLPPRVFTVNRDHALASFSGRVEINGEALGKWAPLSGMYETADGRFVQVHCNFAHHAKGVVDLLGCEAERSAVAAAIKGREATALEAALIERGMIGAMYRSLSEWDSHPHAVASSNLPLFSVHSLGDAAPVFLREPLDRALDGVNVLDASRVLAGPVAAQTLAAHGANVVRVGAENLPFVDAGVISTGFGKRNTYADLDTSHGRSAFRKLLEHAHVFVDAFRPGALAAKGFSAEEAASINPGIVVVQLSAFDWVGPWAGRRGFDSIVQTTTGLAHEGGRVSGSPKPIHLPVQALDYATGFFAAHAVSRLLAHQRQAGGSWLVRLSLLRTRNWLVDLYTPPLATSQLSPTPSIDQWLHTVDTDFGSVTAPRAMAGRWDLQPARLGTSPPTF